MTEGREEYGDYSVDDEDQLQAEDTLDDRGVDDVLDEGINAREDWSPGQGFGNTPAEEQAGETLDQRIRQEEPDYDPATDTWDEEDLDDGEVGRRALRPADRQRRRATTASSRTPASTASAASAEEAAMHVIDEG